MIKRKNIVVGMTAFAVILSSGVIAFAATDAAISQTEKVRPAMMISLTEAQREAVQQARADSMEEAIAELIDSDTITQEEADKLLEIRSTPKDTLKGTNGIGALTEDQRTALHEEEKAEFESQLAVLVDDGIITQDQADQMELGHKMMSDESLTDEQKEAVMQAKSDAMKAVEANLVEDGTITQEEADAISDMMSKSKPDENGDSSILTEDQRTALNEAIKTKLESKLADLVDDGTLTQELADQLLNDRGGLQMGPGGKHGHGPGGKPGTDENPVDTEGTTL